jgi:GAF domain-containing protein
MSARASDRKGEARLRAEVAAAAEREAALARIAQRINEHPLDVDGTLLEISEAARKLTTGDGARVWLLDGEHFTPTRGAMPDGPDEFVHQRRVVEASSDTPVARCVRERRTVAVDDFLEVAQSGIRREAILAARFRSTMAAPLGTGDAIAGSLAVVRSEVRPFNATEMATLEAFAAQAAIAIETARAQQALAEGLERETATAEILRIIGQSPGDVGRAVAEIGHAARRLCEAEHGVIVFSLGGTRERERWQVWDQIRGLRDVPGRLARERIATSSAQWVGPIEAWQADNPGGAAKARGDGLTEAALLAVPLLGATGPMGQILVRRSTARSFHPRHVALLEHFANQAVIALENGRMFAELEARNREVAEALEQQTATAEVLDVSAAPANLQARARRRGRQGVSAAGVRRVFHPAAIARRLDGHCRGGYWR